MDKIIGRIPVLEALKSDTTIEKVFIQDSVSGEFEIEIRTLCDSRNIPLSRVPRQKLDREARGNHQGIFALASVIRYVELDTLLQNNDGEGRKALFLMLDGIKDVRNFGAIARSAEVFGVDAIIIPAKGSAAINEQAIKASAGALVHLPICRVSPLQDAFTAMGRIGIMTMGASNSADKVVTEMDFDHPVAIVLGDEERGISKHLQIYFDEQFRIPQSGKTESLNVSVATGIILYEIIRQRGKS